MIDLVILLSICLAAMLLTNLTRCRKYDISYPKAVIITSLLMILGILGTYILYFIENGAWGGKSFFGAVLFTPLLMIPVAYLCRVRKSDLMDLIAPPGLLMFCIYKFNCYLSGCCRGMILGYTDGKPIAFPSQIVESISALIIAIWLLYIEKKRNVAGRLWPIALIAYGTARFILNWFRRDRDPFVWVLPAGNFWALVAIAVGIFWIIFVKKRAEGIYNKRA